jgi:hypothetical protein
MDPKVFDNDTSNHEYASNATQSFDDFKIKADLLSLEESASVLNLSDEDELKAVDTIVIQNK